MKTQKAKNWELISEGIVTASQIGRLQKMKHLVSLVLLSTMHQTIASSIEIWPLKGGKYDVWDHTINPGEKVNKKPYKYLSCAVRRAVKSYKVALRTGDWKMITK